MVRGPRGDPRDLHDRLEVGQLVGVGLDLVDLALVLGEDDPGPGVTEDEGDVVVLGGGVDGRRGGPRGHDRQVGQDPLDARARGDRDPVLELDAEGQQPGGELEGGVLGLGPRRARPSDRHEDAGRPRGHRTP